MLSRFSRVWLFATHRLLPTRLLCPWGSSDQDTGVGCHALLWYLPNRGIQPVSLTSPALAGVCFTTSTTWEDHNPVKLILCVRWDRGKGRFFFFFLNGLLIVPITFVIICNFLIFWNMSQTLNSLARFLHSTKLFVSFCFTWFIFIPTIYFNETSASHFPYAPPNF